MSTYTNALSQQAESRLISQYGYGAKRYGTVASWSTILKGFYFDITGNSIAESLYKSHHPAQLHYGIWNNSHIQSFDESIRNATTLAFSALGFKTGIFKRLIHLGSGFGGVDIQICLNNSYINSTGISIDPLQIQVSNQLAKLYKLNKQVQFLQGNFLNPDIFPSLSYDGAIALESICHIPTRQLGKLWSNLNKSLKTNSPFVIHDWYLKPNLNSQEKELVKIFLKGWDLPSCPTISQITTSASSYKFKLVSNQDLTQFIIPSAHKIKLRAHIFDPLVRLFQNSNIPYVQSLGITKPEAIDFTNTCLVQEHLFKNRILTYHQLVFKKTTK